MNETRKILSNIVHEVERTIRMLGQTLCEEAGRKEWDFDFSETGVTRYKKGPKSLIVSIPDAKAILLQHVELGCETIGIASLTSDVEVATLMEKL
jgi:hypothetical protein